VEITTTSWLTITAPSIISTNSVQAPYFSTATQVRQYMNIVTISTSNVVPSGGAEPGTINVPVLKLAFKTDVSTAQLLKLQFAKGGTLNDAEILAVKLYHDSNNVGYFNQNNIGAYTLVSPSTVSFGTDSNPGMVTLPILPSPAGQKILKTPKYYYLAVDLAPGAVIGRTVNLRLANKDAVTVSAPNTVAETTFASQMLYVKAPPQRLSVNFENKLSTWVVQGQSAVLVASFTVSASSYTVDLNRLDFSRGGNCFDADISAVTLYRDNGNGVWDGQSEVRLLTGSFASGVVSFNLASAPETIVQNGTYLYYLVADISGTATYGRTFGVDMPSAGYMRVNEPHTVSSIGLPFISSRAMIKPTVDIVTITGSDSAPTITQGDSNRVMGRLRLNTDANSAILSTVRFDKIGTTPDADILRIKLYNDLNADGVLDSSETIVGTLQSLSVGMGVMVVIPPQSISNLTYQNYLVVVDVSSFAVVDSSFSLRVTPAVTAPDVAQIIGDTITFNMAGAIIDLPDTIYMSFTDIASRSLYVGAENTQLAKISFWADRDAAYLTGMKFSVTGTAGPDDIPLIRFYRDTDGSGFFDPRYDALVTTAAVSAGETYVYLPDIGDLITASTRTYFVVTDISEAATIGNTFSMSMSNENSLFVSGLDRAAAFSGVGTALSTIRDPRVPTPPEIYIYRADGTMYAENDEAFNAYRTMLSFRWDSTAYAGSIEQVYYYVGTSEANESTQWIAAGGARDVSIRGLNLLNNGTYMISIKVKNSVGAYYSDIVSKRLIVDTVVPTLPSGAVYTSAEAGDLLLNWVSATVGISGIAYYVVESRLGNSPKWVTVSTTTEHFLAINGTGATASAAGRAPGAYFYRVYAVNNAGVSGGPSDQLSVNINLEALAVISSASVYPNPFDSRRQNGTIAFTLNKDSEVAITIYDAYGRKVKSLGFSGIAGANAVSWAGDGPNGKVSMGMYICVIKAAGVTKILKIGVKH